MEENGRKVANKIVQILHKTSTETGQKWPQNNGKKQSKNLNKIGKSVAPKCHKKYTIAKKCV